MKKMSLPKGPELYKMDYKQADFLAEKGGNPYEKAAAGSRYAE